MSSSQDRVNRIASQKKTSQKMSQEKASQEKMSQKKSQMFLVPAQWMLFPHYLQQIVPGQLQ